MANTLRFKRGLVAGIPNGALGEPLFTTDTFDLYIGNGTGNTRFQKYIASGATTQILRGDGSLYTFPLNISSPSNGQVLKYDGTNWVNSADAGVTGSGTAGQVTFWGSSSTITGSNNLFWDASNNRLGIGTNAPSRILDVRSSGLTIASIRGGASSNQGASYYVANSGGTGTLAAFGDESSIVGGTPDAASMIFSGTTIPLKFYIGGAERARFFTSGNLHLGGTSDNGLRFQVTGDGFFSGSVGIGTSSITSYGLRVNKTIVGALSSTGIYQDGTVQSTVTSNVFGIYNSARTQAASFTLSNYYHYYADQFALGAGSSITNQYGYVADSTLTGATNNYGFFGNIASGTGRWNLYMNGSAANFLNGDTSVGTTTMRGKFQVKLGVATAASTIASSGFDNTYALFGNPDTLSGQCFGIGAQRSLDGINLISLNPTSDWVDTNYYSRNHIFYGTGVERMRLTSGGNLGLGVTPSYKMHVFNAGSVTSAIESSGAGTSSALRFISPSNYWLITNDGTNAHLTFNRGGTDLIRFSNLGNLLVGTTTDAGFRLDVNGTMRVSGASTFARITAVTSGINLDFNSGILYHFGGSGDYYQFISGANYFLHNRTATGSLIFGTNGTDRMRIDANGNVGLNVTPSAWSGRAIQIGARASIASVTDDLMLTNNAFYDGTNWKYIQSTLASNYYQSAGVHVWRTAVSGTAGNNITWTEQMRVFANGNLLVGSSATDNGQRLQIEGSVRVAGDIIITGGNGYDVINSGGNTTTALRSTSGGTSIMSSVSNGLHIAVGTENAGDLILASNNTERIRLSSNGFFSQINATNPSSSITDSYIQYSADVTAGNAAPHFRTENGAVIKLYQETTGVGNAIFSQGGGNSVLDDSTFDGYTLRQIVKALRNQGILQ